MKLATFNVNGIGSRLPHLLQWLEREAPDIVCLQELKAADARFPAAQIRDAGYGAIWQGQKPLWNGVAILARGTDPIELRRGLPGDAADTQSRYLEAAVQGILVGCLYLPNGNPQPGPKFDYKLAWFERLIAHAKGLVDSPHPVALVGDYNVVPTDELDIYNPRSWRKDALLQPQTPRALPSPARPGLGGCDPQQASQGAHLHVLGLLQAALAARRRPAHRSPAAQPDTGAAARRRWASIAGCAAWNARATTRPPG